MRWDNLRLEAAAGDGDENELPLGLAGSVVRRFDTPDFRGITCYEIRSKSILNKVPAGSSMPFRWTLNPYRGCTHACTYCLAGDTPILMADGRTRPLQDLQVGDQIYGTERRGNHRRYVTTTVLAHWSTTKPAYRVTLEDGTRLIASGDHRFLTDRGWKYVTAGMTAGTRRPHLTTGDSLVGVGRFATGPKPDDDYRRGYLCGMVRGDAAPGASRYPTGAIHRFRLALTDLEAVDRAQRYLADFGVPTTRINLHDGADGQRPITAIRTSTPSGSETVTQLIEWPLHPHDSWVCGFLAGIFDAAGSCSQGALRISHSDDTILSAITGGLARLGIDYVVEGHGRADRVRAVRVRGGLAARLRFFHAVDPAITRMRTIDGMAVKGDAQLGVTSVEPLGIELPLWDITTGTGDFIADGVISHNCFARNTHTYLDLDSGHDFDSRIVVKVNAPDLLRKELAAKSWQGEHIAMGTNVDPYQRAEGRYRLMRSVLAILRDYRNPFSILTKGTLVLRDLDLLADAAQRAPVSVNVSIGFVDSELWRQVEPGTPSPVARLGVCRSLVDAGIGCSVLMAPILPFLTDTDAQLEATVAAVADAGASSITPLVLHLRPGAREWYLGWLRGARPELLGRYERMYARGSYAPAEYTTAVVARVRELAHAYGISSRTASEYRLPEPPRPSGPPAAVAEQLPLLPASEC